MDDNENEMTKIEKLLEISGLSCDDLLNKLQSFKTKGSANVANGQHKNNVPEVTPANADTQNSETRANQAETRDSEAETRVIQSEARDNQSETRDNQSETRDNQSESRDNQSETRANQPNAPSESNIAETVKHSIKYDGTRDLLELHYITQRKTMQILKKYKIMKMRKKKQKKKKEKEDKVIPFIPEIPLTDIKLEVVEEEEQPFDVDDVEMKDQEEEQLFNDIEMKDKEEEQPFVDDVEMKDKEEEQPLNDDVVIKDKEEVRNKLKEQLELLRTTRKRTNFICSAIPNREWRDYKSNKCEEKRLKRMSRSQSEEDSRDKAIAKTIVDPVLPVQEDLPVSVPVKGVDPEESPLVIVSVIGGYKSPEHEPSYTEELDESEKCIKLTKTTDCTRIKGWKNKKFVAPADADSALPLEGNVIVTDEPIADTSTSDKIYLLPSTAFGIKQEPTTVVESSAFVSDELDQFLNQNVNLNISYEIPKLHAEESLDGQYEEAHFAATMRAQARASPKAVRNPPKPDEYKPKTLAEKRMLMQQEMQRKLQKRKEEEAGLTLKALIAENSFHEESTKDLISFKQLCEEDVPFTKFRLQLCEDTKECYVNYNGKRLRVTAVKGEEEIAKIVAEKPAVKCRSYDYIPIKARKRRDSKPSLLNALKSPPIPKVKYRPGPLCKKRIANSASAQKWVPIIKRLPKVTVEITPEIGKQIHPQIEPLIADSGLCLTKQRVDMALSVLKAKDTDRKKRSFAFPVPYRNNQEQIVLRGKVEEHLEPTTIEIVEESADDVQAAINSVMSKMLDYVENQVETAKIEYPVFDIEDRASSTESTASPVFDSADKGPSTETVKSLEAARGVKRKRAIFNRTKNEMKRLNCKVVSIAIATEEKQLTECTSDVCRLGCVCNSLKGIPANLITHHCRNIDCMFECSCGYAKQQKNQQITLPIGTNLFSAGTINHIQNEAKKDLAKEEKDFTPTVIEANNELIVVENLKERQRRTTKVPKRYSSYVVDHELERHQTQAVTTVVTKPVRNVPTPGYNLPQCTVSLTKYDFSALVPYCMVHNLYKCHCCGSTTPNKGFYESKPLTPALLQPPATSVAVKRSQRGHVIKQGNFFDKDSYCSRTRGISTAYYRLRNRTTAHKKKIAVTTAKLKKDLRQFLREKVGERDKMAATAKPDEGPEMNASRRKQALVARDFSEFSEAATMINEMEPEVDSKEMKMQRRKLKLQQLKNVAVPAKAPSVAPSSNVKAPESLRNECFNLLGDKASQVRLLPWQKLATCYNNQTLQVWYCTTGSPKVLLTEDGQRPGKQYCNIRLFKQMKNAPVSIDVIRWLISNTVPQGKCVENIYVILKFKHLHWEICGICEKNIQEQLKNGTRVGGPRTDKNLYVSLMRNSLESSGTTPASNSSSTANSTDEFDEEILTGTSTPVGVMRDKRLRFPKVTYNRTSFNCLKLVRINDDPSKVPESVAKILFAPLPRNLLQSRWRVLDFNDAFQHVTFLQNGYTIRRKQIVTAMNLTQSTKTTVYIKSFSLKKNYGDRWFGIYCVADLPQKFFIGPYGLKEDHALEITSIQNEIECVHTHGYWFIHCAEKNCREHNSTGKVKERVVDLTAGDSDTDADHCKMRRAREVIEVLVMMTSKEPKKDQIKSLTNSKFGGHFMAPSLHENFPKKISGEDVDNIRFIVTNVKDFGYIPAYQEPNGPLYVKCPLQKCMRSFATTEEVISVYEKELKCWFVMAPLNFRIQITILNDIEGCSMVKPINPSVISGYNIVGEFGVLETSLDNRKALAKHGLTNREISLVLLYRGRKAAQYATSAILQAVQAPMRYPAQEVNRNFYYALTMLNQEVILLKDQEQELSAIKEDLHQKKLQCVVKYTELMRQIPPQGYQKAKDTLHEIIRMRGKRSQSPLSSIHPLVPIRSKNDEICIEPVDASDTSSVRSYCASGTRDELEVIVLQGDDGTATSISPTKLRELIPNVEVEDEYARELAEEENQRIYALAHGKYYLRSARRNLKSLQVNSIDKFIPEVILDEGASASTDTQPKTLKELLHPRATTSDVVDVMLDKSSELSSLITSKLAEKALNNLIVPKKTTAGTTVLPAISPPTPAPADTTPESPTDEPITLNYYQDAAASAPPTSSTAKKSPFKFLTRSGPPSLVPLSKTKSVVKAVVTDVPATSPPPIQLATLTPITTQAKLPKGLKVSKPLNDMKEVLVAATSSPLVKVAAVTKQATTAGAAGTLVTPPSRTVFNGAIAKAKKMATPFQGQKVVKVMTKSGLEIPCVVTTGPPKTKDTNAVVGAVPKDAKTRSIALPKSAVPTLKPGYIAVRYKDGTTKYIPFSQRLSFTSSLLNVNKPTSANTKKT